MAPIAEIETLAQPRPGQDCPRFLYDGCGGAVVPIISPPANKGVRQMSVESSHMAENHMSSRDPLCVRVPEARRLLSIGRSKLYEMIAAGEIEIIKIGTSTRVVTASLRRLVGQSG